MKYSTKVTYLYSALIWAVCEAVCFVPFDKLTNVVKVLAQCQHFNDINYGVFHDSFEQKNLCFHCQSVYAHS